MSLVWQAKGEHNIARGYRDELFHISTARVEFADQHWIVAAIISDEEIVAGAVALRNTIWMLTAITRNSVSG